jgi:putative transposase
LMIETPEANLSVGMRQLNGMYTQKYNRRHDKPGHLFQGRFRAILVQKENYLLELCRYVVLNPIRAGVVEKPEAWKWSSYQSTAGLRKKPDYLATDWIMGILNSQRIRAHRSNIGRLCKKGSLGDLHGWSFRVKSCWEKRDSSIESGKGDSRPAKVCK